MGKIWSSITCIFTCGMCWTQLPYGMYVCVHVQRCTVPIKLLLHSLVCAAGAAIIVATELWKQVSGLWLLHGVMCPSGLCAAPSVVACPPAKHSYLCPRQDILTQCKMCPTLSPV